MHTVEAGQTIPTYEKVALYSKLQKAMPEVLYTCSIYRRMIACLMVILWRHLIVNQ